MNSRRTWLSRIISKLISPKPVVTMPGKRYKDSPQLTTVQWFKVTTILEKDCFAPPVLHHHYDHVITIQALGSWLAFMISCNILQSYDRDL